MKSIGQFQKTAYHAKTQRAKRKESGDALLLFLSLRPLRLCGEKPVPYL
jgi:hypothetical protein